MKIDNSIKSVGSTATGDARAKGNAAATGTQPSASSDKVELSSLSSSLQKADAAMEATPVVDQSRVDEIKQAITDGRFQVDAGKVADGLIESVKQMLAAQPQKV